MIATIPTALAAGGIFSDVPNGAWYADAVDYVYEHGIMNGTSATTFSPNTPMTRAMLVTVLHRAAGSPSAATGTAFSDVPSGAYYTDAVAWASANGIVTGYGNGRFGSNDPVSRAKIAAILNCSVATIHTYRAQLRNAAIGDRNAFDDAIRRIDIAGAEPSQTA